MSDPRACFVRASTIGKPANDCEGSFDRFTVTRKVARQEMRGQSGRTIDTEKFRDYAQSGDWNSLYALLDIARTSAVSRDDRRSEVHWRAAALEQQLRHEEALDLLRDNASLFNSQCHVKKACARLLVKLDRHREALDELRTAPFEDEMKSFHASAIDAKFVYLHLLAEAGDAAEVNRRLSEIPDDYEHITRGGEILTKQSIWAALNAKS